MFRKLFKQLNPEALNENFFRLIDKDWMLVTAGQPGKYNTMTASWGFTGILWNKAVAVCFIRPQRYTYEFVENNDFFTLSFFDDDHKEALNYCGTHTGRNTDKAMKTGLTPIETPEESTTFEQSRLVIECKKLYSDTLKEENFLSRQIIQQHYAKKDFHRFFIGEITGCYIKV